MRLSVLTAIVLVTATVCVDGRRVGAKQMAGETAARGALDAVDRAIEFGGRLESEKAAARLREIGKRNLNANDRDTWLRLSRDVAIRLGDSRYLESLRDVADSDSLENTYLVLLAYSKLAKADMAGASTVLDGLRNVRNLSVRDERRVLGLRARIAQLRGDPADERAQIEKILDHLPDWPSPRCQSCHASMDEGGKQTGLPIKQLWFTQRYVELLRQSGSVSALAEARSRLIKSPGDTRASIQAGLALMAQGKGTEADAILAHLPWIELPGRTLLKPHMLVPFP